MADMFHAAVDYAARGWRVLPLHTLLAGRCTCGGRQQRCTPGKHPIGKLTPHGLKDATADPAKLQEWWTKWPDANIGIATGADSGLIVLDVDPAHGGEDNLHELELANGQLPHTVEAITGSGGRHIYFQHPGIVVNNSAGRVAQGIDVRGDDGYVVAPPSLHRSGRRYEWEISSEPVNTRLAAIPSWLLALMADAPSRNGQVGADATATPSGLPVSRAAMEFSLHGAPIGQQRERAVAAARSYLSANYTVQDAARFVWQGLERSPCGDPARPWTEQDATDIAANLASSPAPPPKPLSKPQSSASASTVPVIYATTADLAEVTAECWQAIRAANQPPRYFRYGGLPVRIEADDQQAPVIREMTPDRLRHELARIARWRSRKQLKSGTWHEQDARPPLDVMRDVLATPDPPLPILSRIVEVPVFAADGTVQTTPGYHAAARTYYAPAPELMLPTVPAAPTTADVTAARDLILDMLCDFPFVAEADRAHAVSLLLLPFVRDMIAGPTPNHLIEAPTAGCGKGLLADILVMPAAGNHVGIVTNPKDEDEFRKRLTAQLKEGRAAVLLDNVSQLSSSTLAAVLTASVWDDRVLGRTEMVSLAVRCAWVTTANNPTMSTELARRCVRIRLDPMRDRPWQREGFRHPNLRGWATEHRGQLVSAALTLAHAWIVAGQPAARVPMLGSYEWWTTVIGGILQHAGIPGFLENLNEFYEAADVEGAIWRQFVAAWHEKHGNDEVGTADLFLLAVESDGFDIGKGTERAQRTSFGKQLACQRDRVIGNYRIVQAGTSHKAKRWRLLEITKTFPDIPRPLFNEGVKTFPDVPRPLFNEGVKTFPDVPRPDNPGNMGNIGERFLTAGDFEKKDDSIYIRGARPENVPPGSLCSPPGTPTASGRRTVDRAHMQELLDAGWTWTNAMSAATIDYEDTTCYMNDEVEAEIASEPEPDWTEEVD